MPRSKCPIPLKPSWMFKLTVKLDAERSKVSRSIAHLTELSRPNRPVLAGGSTVARRVGPHAQEESLCPPGFASSAGVAERRCAARVPRLDLQCPSKAGLRFSAKARTPSLWSRLSSVLMRFKAS